jgi:acetyl coenzyme A synthetase (ADP forming)-like protein
MSGRLGAVRETTEQTHVVLRDGSTVQVRRVEPDDATALEAFLAGLSAESRLLRYFSGAIDVERTAWAAAHPKPADGHAVVATTGTEARIIGHGSFERERTGGDRAEVALAVADAHQRRGLGTLILKQLADVACAMDVTVFTAHVLPQNHRMLSVLRDSGFPITRHAVPGDIEIEFPTELTPEGRARFEDREKIAATAAVEHVLAPTSVAVIGASRDRGTPGAEVFHNLVTGGFAGPVYPVNPATTVVQSVAAYPSVASVPGPVDLAVIAVPADVVLATATECAAAGVHALVVLSAGFAETDEAGRDRQRQLLTVCRQAGMRLVGPNCLGIVNTDPDVRLAGHFGPNPPRPGRVGFLSQSGALGLAIIDHANHLGLGLSSFVSIGNKADLSGNDLLQWWESDPRTRVVLLYLESFGNPRKFARIARRLTRTTPVVVVKSGRTPAGARAAASHTGALLGSSDRTVDALFRQAGIVRTDTLSELFDVATLLTNQPLPEGDRVGIVTNAGGPAILCADACVAEGLDVVGLSPDTAQQLRRVLPPAAAVGNPVDTLAAVAADDFARAVTIVGLSGDVDAVIAIHIPAITGEPTAVASALQGAVADIDGRVPVLAVSMSSAQAPTAQLREDGIPTYAFPEDAVRALGHAVRHNAYRRAPVDEPAEPAGLRHDEASALLADALGGAPRGRWLTPDEVARLLECYGIRLLTGRTVRTTADVLTVALETPGAVAVKAVAEGLVHKSDIGAVRLDLETDEQIRIATDDVRRAVASAGLQLDGYLVQPMVRDGVEMLAGVTADPTFGPVVVCGAGGATVELLNDISVRITPLTAADAAEMLTDLVTFPLLNGYRGAPTADVGAVEDLLLRLSALAEHQAVVAELDCNPVMVDQHGAVVLDARVLLRPPR